MTEDVATQPWWATAVVYQVYIRSFRDTDGDGVGDLEGVIAGLDYLVSLGVDAIWLAPFHPSPMIDGGYDIADFCGVDARFGTLATFNRLVAAAHRRGLKVIIDFVPNHTSDQHPWFAASRSSRADVKRDWYVWHDGRDGGPPNNWRSMLGGSAWTRDPATGQYYYHAFLPEQPDLNWRNPDVRDAVCDVLRFWLARGVDGVRVDAVPHLVEDELLRDDLGPDIDIGGMLVQGGLRHIYTMNRPENLSCMAQLRRVIDSFDDRLLIGEIHLPMPLVMRYHGVDQPGVQLAFNFTLLETTPWNAEALAAGIDEYIRLLPGGASSNWLLGNHDEVRVASRLGQDRARVAAMMALTLGGTAFIYNGDELGLEDVALGLADIGGIPEMRHPDHALQYAPHRTPMPWRADTHAGFSTVTPWLPHGLENAMRNVEAQNADDRSMLAFYRSLIALRRERPELQRGVVRQRPLQGDVLLYERGRDDGCILIAVNLGASPTVLEIPSGAVVLSTHLDRTEEHVATRMTLRAFEGVAISVQSPDTHDDPSLTPAG